MKDSITEATVFLCSNMGDCEKRAFFKVFKNYFVVAVWKKKTRQVCQELGPQNCYPFKPSEKGETYEHNFVNFSRKRTWKMALFSLQHLIS